MCTPVATDADGDGVEIVGWKDAPCSTCGCAPCAVLLPGSTQDAQRGDILQDMIRRAREQPLRFVEACHSCGGLCPRARRGYRSCTAQHCSRYREDHSCHTVGHASGNSQCAHADANEDRGHVPYASTRVLEATAANSTHPSENQRIDRHGSSRVATVSATRATRRSTRTPRNLNANGPCQCAQCLCQPRVALRRASAPKARSAVTGLGDSSPGRNHNGQCHGGENWVYIVDAGTGNVRGAVQLTANTA